MPNAFLAAKAIARMIAGDDPYGEGRENHTVTFLEMFLPERYLKSKTNNNNENDFHRTNHQSQTE